MLNAIRSRLTYANVTATLALFLAIGGVGYAATQLPKNSVGTKQLKKGSVTAAKIKAHAVTGSKLDLSTLGAVPAATHATSADSATHATSADSAAQATDAGSVGGQQIKRISFIAPKGTPETTLFEAIGLKITASCEGSGAVKVRAVPDGPAESELQVHGDSNNAFFSHENSAFGAGGPVFINGPGGEGSAVLVYGTASGHVATITYSFDSNETFSGQNHGCGVSGEAVFG